MAFSGLTFIFLLHCLFVININCNNDYQEMLNDFYRPQIWSALNYLNLNPRRVYNYNYATLTSAQNTDSDTTDLTLDVEVNCRYAKSNKCITNLLECKGTVRYNFDLANYEVISEIFCTPKIKIDFYNAEIPIQKAINYNTNLNQEPVSEIPIIKTKGPCVGCPSDLNTNLEALNSLTNTALCHIEAERDVKHVIVRIIRAQSQVVAGIKYILLLEVAPTDCPKTVDKTSLDSCRILNENSQICEVTYYQRPWISRNKDIISNNCTSSQEFAEENNRYPGNDQDNEIDPNYFPGNPSRYPEQGETGDLINYDSIADNGNADEISKMTGVMDSARLRDLESQIILSQPATETEVKPSTESVLADLKDPLDDFIGTMGDGPREKRSAKNNDDDSSSSSSSSEEDDNNNDDKQYEKTKRKSKKFDDNNNNNNDDDDDDSSSSSSSSEEDDKNKKLKPKKTKREVKSSESVNTKEEKQESTTVALTANQVSSEEESSEEHRGGVRRKRSLNTADLVKITSDEKNFVENLADFAVYTLDDIDADHHKRIVLQVLGAKKNLPGDLYHLTLRVGISRCLEEKMEVIDLQKPNHKDKDCRNRLIENLTKICRVQIRLDDDKTNPKVEKSQCQNIKKDHDIDNNRTNRSKRQGVPGGVNTVDPKDAKIVEYAQNIIQEWDASEGSDTKREFVQVISASKQVVSGILYRFEIEFVENGSKTVCNFKVWEQAWIKPSKNIDVDCKDGKVKKQFRAKRSHNLELLGKDDHDVHVGLFKNFMAKYNKKYENKSEFKKRFNIFRQNMKIIKKLNDNELGTAKYGPTIFTDFTSDEFKGHLGLNPSLHNPNSIPMPHAKIPDVELPKEFDWRKKGVVSEVKNQGACGSCWAFSVTGNIEGLNAIKSGKLIELSEQELVDCDDLDSGCNGGLPDNAYRAIETLGGLETETDYPYEAENEKCHFNKTLTKVQISGAVNISSNEDDMAKWLIKNGPISIGINANAMQFYFGGVSHPLKFLCNPDNLDHGVLIVGYGIHKYPLFKKELPYWIVKNSWGSTWGEQGYYRVYKGDGTCGLNKMASSAIL